MDTLATAANIFFHLFMIFLAIYSAMAIFILLRYGRSRIVTTAASFIYILLISSLYFQTLSFIHQL